MEDLMRSLDECIELELNVSDLYMLYSRFYEEDREFWWTLMIEEQNHASLLKSARVFAQIDRFPRELMTECYDDACRMNSELSARVKEMHGDPLPFCEAITYARKVENFLCEHHYQKFMTMESEDKVINILQGIGKDELDHSERIISIARKRSCQ